MRVFNLLNHILNEANVYNLSVNYDGVSLKGYIERLVSPITVAQDKQGLTKKLTTLLVNDERFLQPIRQLPVDAPSWANEAFQKGELVTFTPNPELNDTLSNIVHYVVSCEQHMSSHLRDVVVNAQRELSAIPKVPNLDELSQKANAYFAVVQNVQTKQIDGMEQVADYKGWKWYKLLTSAAFKRYRTVLVEFGLRRNVIRTICLFT
jgi:hypothetical protein